MRAERGRIQFRRIIANRLVPNLTVIPYTQSGDFAALLRICSLPFMPILLKVWKCLDTLSIDIVKPGGFLSAFKKSNQKAEQMFYFLIDKSL